MSNAAGSLILTGEEPRQLKAGGRLHLKKLVTLKNKNEELDKAFEVKRIVSEMAKVETAIETLQRGTNALNEEERTWAVKWAELYEHNCSAARGTMQGLGHEQIAVQLMEEANLVKKQLIPKCREAAGMPEAKDDDQSDWTKEPGADPRATGTGPAKKKTAKKKTAKGTRRRRSAAK